MARTRSRQLTLDDARPITGHGGWRPHAGRPRGRSKIAHAPRAPFRASSPLLVTLRAADGPYLRTRAVLAVVCEVIRRAHRASFRIVHFNLLSNHLHLIVEAANRRALASGMRGLGVRLTRNINHELLRRGQLFPDRYHSRALPTPTEVRSGLRYVLLNGNRHEAARGETVLWYGVDPYSSGAWFDGWADDRWRFEQPGIDRPTALAQTWLLREGWLRAGGPIAFDDTPGAT